MKKRLVSLCLFALLCTLAAASLSTPTYAMRSFGEDCKSCHKSGITVSTNATGVVRIPVNGSFCVQVNASGGSSDQMTLLWSNVSHNAYFSFKPSAVEDNKPEDGLAAGGSVGALFKVSAPRLKGNYTLTVYSASSKGKGGSAEVKVVVGSGGEAPKNPPSSNSQGAMIELLTTVAPNVLIGIAAVGAVLTVVSWRRIPG